MQATLGTLIVPASYEYALMRPWGSHPFVDPMWSNPHLRIVHDGAEATRLRKVRAISGYDPAMKYLRVCYPPLGGQVQLRTLREVPAHPRGAAAVRGGRAGRVI